jgi:hypothetical protein
MWFEEGERLTSEKYEGMVWGRRKIDEWKIWGNAGMKTKLKEAHVGRERERKKMKCGGKT